MRWFSSSAESRSPLERTFERKFAPDFCGEVYTWDVDNTYIRTNLGSFRAMLSIPFEMAIDKLPFPGVPELLQEIRRGPEEASRETPLFFVSASPRQLRPVLEQRMLLDGIQQDGFTLRDWGALLRGGRFRALRDPVGYKLTALLQNRAELPPGALEMLFGDDTERDALIYCLYGDILAGRLRDDSLRTALHGMQPEDAERIVSLASELPEIDAVQAIFVHLASGRGPERFDDYGLRLYPVMDYFQAALALMPLKQIGERGLRRVEAAVAAGGRNLQESFEDACRRGLIPPDSVAPLAETCGCTPPVLEAKEPPEAPEPGPQPGFLTPLRYRQPGSA